MIAIFPEITHCAAAGDVERLGILVREYFGGAEKHAPRLSVATVLENLGIRVVRGDVDGLGALLAHDQKGAFSITCLLTTEPTTFDQRFLLAHLFGHYLLHVQPFIARGDWVASGFREQVCASERYATTHTEDVQRFQGAGGQEARREWEADAFAAAMLLPKGMVLRAMARLQSAAKTAQFFGVSEMCLARRLEQLADPMQQPAQAHMEQPSNFLSAEARLRRPEPEAILPQPRAAVKVTSSQVVATYQSQTQKAGGKTGSAQAAADVPASTPKSGMERLRQIAKRLDKSMD